MQHLTSILYRMKENAITLPDFDLINAVWQRRVTDGVNWMIVSTTITEVWKLVIH